jgi:integrase
MIREYMSDTWISSTQTQISRENRFLLRALVSLMATTGLTPGLETELVTPFALIETDDTNGRPAIRVTIKAHQGKRAPDRIVWARTNDVWPVVEDMRQLRAWIKANRTEQYHRANPSGYLFCRPSDGEFPIYHRVFEEVLEALKIRVDPVHKVNRRLYSCRHYYATQALMTGVEVAYVAKNMGTSERMIHEHYEHIITDLRAAVLTGSQIGVRAMTVAQREALRAELDAIINDPDDHLGDLERHHGRVLKPR